MPEAIKSVGAGELGRPVSIGLRVDCGEMIDEGVWVVELYDGGALVRSILPVVRGRGVGLCIRGGRDQESQLDAKVASCAGDPGGGFKMFLEFVHAIDSCAMAHEIGFVR